MKSAAILVLCLCAEAAVAFQSVGIVGAGFARPTHPPHVPQVDGSSVPAPTALFMAPTPADEIDLKAELTEYLQVRKERNADEEAQKEVGRVIGGTKGNKVLDFVLAPQRRRRYEKRLPTSLITKS